MLARNSNSAAKGIKQMEDCFVKCFRYPYVFLDEEPFSDRFKECVTLPRLHPFVTLTVLVIQHDHRRMSALTEAPSKSDLFLVSRDSMPTISSLGYQQRRTGVLLRLRISVT